MALCVNSSSASGIPVGIIREMTNLNLQFPGKWQREWLASLIDAQDNDNWELKLTNENGISRYCILSAEQQNSESVCSSLLELRDTWNG
jgi:hypothetical protein